MFALLVGASAQAQVKPEDIFGGILDIIQDQIAKDQGDDFFVSSGVLLQDLGNGRLALGRITLNNKSTLDGFNLPKCKLSNNQPVTDVRFRVSGADAYVSRVRITFQNNQTEVVDVDEVFEKQTASDWYKVKGDARCIKSITVRGQAMKDKFGSGKPFVIKPAKASVLTFIGLVADDNGF